MEAVPKLALMCFELKISPENTHFAPKLKQYIAEAYHEDPDSYGNEIHQLEGLRSAAVRPTNDGAGMKALRKYFSQLRAIQSRFPMGKGQPAACSFTWKDLYANMNCTMSDIKFEMACILYNIGALHSQLGSLEGRTSADSLKVACQHYQHAAWAFLQVREQYPQPPGADVSCEILKLFKEICFAQAQECILDKSIQDTRKSNVIGSVATQVLLYYKNSLAILGPSTGTDNIHEIVGTKQYNNIHRYLSFKTYYISCFISLYQGMCAEEQQKMGERVGYYQHAHEQLAEAKKLAKYIEPVQLTQDALTFTGDVVEGKRKAAKNENEFIYHEEVPEKDLLLEPKPVCLVQAAPIDFNDSEAGPDLFARLVPLGAHEAASLYSEEKAKLLRHVVAQVEAKDAELVQFMSSLQLDQLDILDEEQKIPQEIVDRCAAMNAKTDVIQTLVDSMNGLAEVITDVEHLLAEIREGIQEEAALERQYQQATGPRPPSLVQTELARELHKYGEAHARTSDSNLVLHKACALHLANLRLLARPLQELAAHIPGLDHVEGLDRSTMRETRRVADKAREMQTQRAALLAELRRELRDDDVTRALLAEPDAPRDRLFRDHLERHTPRVKVIEQNLAAQENIINRLTTLYAAYGDSRRLLTDVLRKRDAVINALITSYDTHEELVAKTSKGLEFYRKLAHNLGALRDRLRAACTLQREERERIMAVDKGSSVSSETVRPHSQAPSTQTVTPANVAPKLKDYLPYMKNRNLSKNVPQQASTEPSAECYPEHVYPTSARPPPVGSEATEPARSSFDGVTSPAAFPNAYVPPSSRAPAYTDTSNQYDYSVKPFNSPQETPTYGYAAVPQYPAAGVPELGAGLAQLQLAPDGPYAHTYFSGQPPAPAACRHTHTYSRAPHAAHTASSSAGAPYDSYGAAGADMTSIPSVANSYEINPRYSEGVGYDVTPQGFILASGESSTTLVSDASSGHYGIPANTAYVDPSLARLDAIDKPIKSHTKGEALSSYYGYGGGAVYQPERHPQGYVQSYQNHPGYMFNSATGSYDYDYGSHNSQAGTAQAAAWSAGLYTSAGTYDTVQSAAPTFRPPDSSFSDTGYSNTLAPVPEQSSNYTDRIEHSGAPQQFSGYHPGAVVSDAFAPASQIPTNYYSSNEQPSVLSQESAPVSISQIPTNYYASNEQPSVLSQESAPVSMSQIPTNYYASNEQPSVLSQESAPVSMSQIPTNYYASNEQASVLSQESAPVSISQIPTNYYASNEQPSVLSQESAPVSMSQIPTNYYASNEQPSVLSQESAPVSMSQIPTNYYASNEQASVLSQESAPVSISQIPTNYYASNEQPSVLSQESAPVSMSQIPTNYYASNEQASVLSQESAPVSMSQIPTNYYASNEQASVLSQESAPVSISQIPTNYYASNEQTSVLSQESAPVSITPMTLGYESNPEHAVAPGHSSNTAPHSVPVSAGSQPAEQVSVSSENPKELSAMKTNNDADVPSSRETRGEPSSKETRDEPTAFDLLADIDFTIEQKPLTPEIKVPPMAEKNVARSSVMAARALSTPAPIPPVARPPRVDIFSDPALLNRFTQEVHNLKTLVETLGRETPSGLTPLDSKWKALQELCAKENARKSTEVARRHSSIRTTDVVPFDDHRLTLDSDPDAYINASHYKQLGPWCIPLVISEVPEENEDGLFWKAMLENKMNCVVCLMSEVETAGRCRLPGAVGQSVTARGGDVRITLQHVTRAAHWTCRTLALERGTRRHSLQHFQIHVYPDKVMCAPLLLLSDAVLRTQRAAGGGACVTCGEGAGRSGVLALLLLLVCQLRAGDVRLCETLERGAAALCGGRRGVLGSARHLADAYRAALFFAQGVLCSDDMKKFGTANNQTDALRIQEDLYRLDEYYTVYK
ncbi:tyrosine-protein phosphatase non-receptor type 23 isoform X2 [Leptidea sinapis]|uniref:tyrosine-protein phosphatase non-receptor type 23 isoform X2 n=1 Tax=Leptidea sinapis TaxID=189913 RepID=UPI0021345C07|nr:tyrosine-protein phosphatase non-receptor type 23 isoform X2 [Leptidea sinapis]